MTIFSKSRHRTQNLCKMRYKKSVLLQMEKEFLLSKMSYLLARDVSYEIASIKVL